MVFQPGNSGNPGGRRKEKLFGDALRLALNEEVVGEGGNKKKLRVIADRLITEAMAGESWAIQQVMDRIDGKPAQAIIGGDEDEPAVKMIHRIERVIVENSADTDSEGL